jgi:hypothetical protein
MGKCKVLFNLETFMLDEQTKWPPGDVETMWAEQLDSRSARLLNYPFYAKDVSFLDVIRTKAEIPRELPEGGVAEFPEFESVTQRSGHGTVRAILRSDDHRQTAERTLLDVEHLGCTLETTSGELVSIDIPPEVDQNKVMAVLNGAASAGAIFLDIGYLRPS